MTERIAGLLVHPSSLPGRFGIGGTGPEAGAFLDWSSRAGQRLWQILPLGPPGPNHSPYDALSAFAGNPLLVSPEGLCDEGLLPGSWLSSAPAFPEETVGFETVGPWKERLLRASFAHVSSGRAPAALRALEVFSADPAQEAWLEDWALFSALRARAGGAAWNEWETPIRTRVPSALDRARRDLAEEIDYHRFVQFVFSLQWGRLRDAARARGIRIMGDVPIYVALDSADVWTHARLFALDEEGRPLTVAGVPPDYFSKDGQLWGNPLYRWDRMAEEGYAWWISRVRASLRLADCVRIDHFRGFVSYWEVPARDRTAVGGRWAPGPGRKFFDALRAALGDLPLIAEDLGHITPDVKALRDELAIPGMRVLQFAFGDPESEHNPQHHPENAVVYTGTHDNDTTRGWFDSLGEEERRKVLDGIGSGGSDVVWDLIRAAYGSRARTAVVPLQDVFRLGSEARMNVPSRVAGNWAWRARADLFGGAEGERLAQLAQALGRA